MVNTAVGRLSRLTHEFKSHWEPHLFTIAAELKEGKSEVVCEAGKLVKLNKDKQGVVSREVLTKQWTDWVDYWAVDFDYESRKEIIKVPSGTGLSGVQGFLPGQEPAQRDLDLPADDLEERWTGPSFLRTNGKASVPVRIETWN